MLGLPLPSLVQLLWSATASALLPLTATPGEGERIPTLPIPERARSHSPAVRSSLVVHSVVLACVRVRVGVSRWLFQSSCQTVTVACRHSSFTAVTRKFSCIEEKRNPS